MVNNMQEIHDRERCGFWYDCINSSKTEEEEDEDHHKRKQHKSSINIASEILEVKSCIKRSPWLIQMVKSRRFHESCNQHITKKLCHFCCDCMVSPLCDACYKQSDHKDHNTIQTYRCSFQSGVRKETISKYMDISGIHTYMINSKTIVFINQRRENENHRCRSNVMHKCIVCEWELDADSSALVCSIECKFRNALGSQLDELMENSQVDEPMENVAKKRKHKRKGIPCRSPLF